MPRPRQYGNEIAKYYPKGKLMNIGKCETFFLCVLALFFANSLANGALVITEAMPNSGHPGGNGNGDWWELTNTGPTTIDLAGYYWDDDPAGSNDGGIFPSFMLAPGASVVLADEMDGDAFAAAYCGGFDVLDTSEMTGDDAFSGLGSGGDSIMLWDHNPVMPGDVPVASVSFGAATAGQSFEWATNGDPLGLSVAGENGAFVACTDGDDPALMGTAIGSPGVVPEPAGIFTAMIALVSLLGLRRR